MAICSAILVREEVRAQFHPEEIVELETIRDCTLRLDEIDGVC